MDTQHLATTPPMTQKNKKILIISAILSASMMIGAGAYTWWQNDQGKNEQNNLVANNTNENINKVEDQETISDEIDYTLAEDLSLVVWPCYVMEHPEGLQYFPDELKEDYKNSSFMTKEDCTEHVPEEAYQYLVSLLPVDKDADGLNLFLETVHFTDDNNKDTDQDGFDDLTEVINGHDPNDLRTARNKALHEQVYEQLNIIGKGDNVDVNKVIEICNLLANEPTSMMDDSDRDQCLANAVFYHNIIDPTFCDKAGINSGWHKICQENLNANIAMAQGGPEECAKLQSGSMPWIECFAHFIEQSKSLDPCAVVGKENFSLCTSSFSVFGRDAFSYLDNTDECYKYKDWLGEYDFDSCLFSVASYQDNPDYCLGLTGKDSFPSVCIESLARAANDPIICAHFFYVDYADNYINYGFPDYQRCLSMVLGEGADIEQATVQGCQSLDIYTPLLDPGLPDLKILLCFAGAAREYDKPEYCDLMPDKIKNAGGGMDACLPS